MIKLEKSETELRLYNIYVDDEICENAYADKNGEILEFTSHIRSSSNKLATQTLKNFGRFMSISLDDYFEWLNFSSTIFIYSQLFDDKIQDGFVGIGISLTPDLEDWKEKYSFYEYSVPFLMFWRENYGDILPLAEGGRDYPGFGCECNLLISDEPIRDFIKPYEIKLKNIHTQVLSTLASSINNSVSLPFIFPEEIKIACEQYLLYFAQFLEDLEINATSSLNEEAGKVLFSVNPTDDSEALDKIREALGIYLNLPSSPITYDESFAAMRLQQQIENLQHSQKMAEREIRTGERELRLSQTVIEHQDKVIHQKDAIIEQQNKVIEKITSKSIMMDSLENKEELEKFCEGFEVGKSDFLIKNIGIHLNPMTVAKNIGKRILGKDDERKSVLGLDEDIKED